MKSEFLVKKGENRLIVIYAGWSSDSRLYAGLRFPEGYDVALVSGYTDLDLNLSFTEGYATIALIAWSLGVWAAENSFPADRVTFAVAVNGTPYPCDDLKGIPSAVFNTTRKRLDERNLRKFRRRMVSSKEDFDNLLPLLPENDDIDSLKSELLFISEESTRRSPDASFPWERAYVSNSDSIFPDDAQREAWKERSDVECVSVEGSHYLKLNPILTALFPEKATVGSKFHSAITTYHDEATAQRAIASHLADLIKTMIPSKGGKLLEIGPATGFLTGCVADILRPTEADFIDLFPTGRFNIADKESYHCCDAETWLPEQEKNWDYIVSSSVVQWFADLNSFFREASRHLNKGGLFAVSTFAPGNLSELSPVTPYGMLYHSRSRIESMLSRHFRHYEVKEGVERLEFPTVREALLHIRHTGVGGGIRSGRNVRDITRAIQPDPSRPATLTYLPLYIIARN